MYQSRGDESSLIFVALFPPRRGILSVGETMTLNDVHPGDVITHNVLHGEGRVTRVGVGTKNDQIAAVFPEESERDRYVELKNITTLNGEMVSTHPKDS